MLPTLLLSRQLLSVPVLALDRFFDQAQSADPKQSALKMLRILQAQPKP